MARLLHSKNITSSQDVVLYGHGSDDAAGVERRLADLGEQVRTHEHGFGLDGGYDAWVHGRACQINGVTAVV